MGNQTSKVKRASKEKRDCPENKTQAAGIQSALRDSGIGEIACAVASRAEADIELVKKHVEALGEHFDSVHIFCTRHEAGEENGTVQLNQYAGNFFARYGQVREWLIRQEEQSRQAVRNEQE